MYQVLARKYRPKNFAELVGQTHVSKALMGALDKQRLHHAYLFTGTRGVGKTTIARILSKCLNCETGITNTPCGTCSVCTAIDAGQFIDLIEIDAASRTKVEDTRELLDQVPYAPTQGRYKVYLIDEVHMLSTHSFNALLKTLEEPPEHVKFLLATTDPQKLPITVMSRCLQFVLRALPRADIRTHLAYVLGKENITFDDDALWKLADSAQGSIRDALSLTDQAIAYGQGRVSTQDVDAMLGLIDAQNVTALLSDIYAQDKKSVAQHLQTMRAQMVDAKAVLDQLVELLFNLALAKDLPQVDLDLSDEARIELSALAAKIHAADLQLYYQIAIQGRMDLRLASNPQQGLEMTLLRMLAFKPFSSSQTLQTSHENDAAAALTSKKKAFSLVDEQPNHSAEADTHAAAQEKHARLDSSQSVANQSAVLAQTKTTPSDVAQQEASKKTTQKKPENKNALEKEVATDKQMIMAVADPATVANKALVLPKPNKPATTKSKDAPVDNKAKTVPTAATSSSAVQAQAAADTTQTPSYATRPLTNKQTLAQPLFENKSKKQAVSAEKLNNTASQASKKSHTNQQVDFINQTDLTAATQGSNAADTHPLDALKPAHVELKGDWDLAKWEYWLYNANLKPEVLNIAQKGVMSGEIGGRCQFQSNKSMEVIHDRFFERLVDALKNDWADMVIHVEKVSDLTETPEKNQLKRKEKAQHLAEKKMRTEPLATLLMQDYGAHMKQLVLSS